LDLRRRLRSKKQTTCRLGTAFKNALKHIDSQRFVDFTEWKSRRVRRRIRLVPALDPAERQILPRELWPLVLSGVLGRLTLARPSRPGGDILGPTRAAAHPGANLRDREVRPQLGCKHGGRSFGMVAAAVAPAENADFRLEQIRQSGRLLTPIVPRHHLPLEPPHRPGPVPLVSGKRT
jgi:hypothetical protein